MSYSYFCPEDGTLLSIVMIHNFTIYFDRCLLCGEKYKQDYGKEDLVKVEKELPGKEVLIEDRGIQKKREKSYFFEF